jgi:hypothetical protein
MALPLSEEASTLETGTMEALTRAGSILQFMG